MRLVHSVDPLAGSVQGETAVAVATKYIGLRYKAGRVVRIGGDQIRSHNLCVIVLSNGDCTGAGDHRQIIRAGDVDGQHLRGAVSRFDCRCVGVDHVFDKLIVSGTHGVCPVATGVDTEGAVTVGAGHCWCHENR